MHPLFTSTLSITSDRRIRAFLAVAEELSFTRAALRLSIAQQPLSKVIAELEADLGVRLLNRTTRQVSLTEAGRVAYAELQDLLQRHDSMRRRVSRAARGETGRLALGTGNYGMNSVLPVVLSEFHERYPDVAITVESGQAMAQLDSLARRDIDIAFALLPLPRDGILLEPVHEGGFVVIVADRLALPGTTLPVPLSRFSSHGFIATARAQAPGVDDMRKTLFAEAGFVPHYVQYASDMPTMLTLAAAGIGALLTPAASCPPNHIGVRHMEIATDHRAVLYMATREDGPSSVVVSNFANLTLEFRERMGWTPAS